MSDFPEQYAPHPGFMQIPQPDYQENDGLMMENISHPDHQRIIDEIRFAALELAGRRADEGNVKYDDCLMTEEFFRQQLESLKEEFGPSFFDTNEVSQRILEIWLESGGVKADHHLTADMFDIQLAVEKAKTVPFNDIQDARLDYSALPDAYFDAQDALFDLPQPEQMAQGQQVLDQFMEEMNPIEDLEAQSLEQIIEAQELVPEGEMANYDIQIEQGPLEQQLQEGFEQMDMEDPYLEPPAQGYGMIPQEMYDEQIQEMLDPFMIPGFYGPMSFGSMPGPGPGGP
jgi:hypothetical protein